MHGLQLTLWVVVVFHMKGMNRTGRCLCQSRSLAVMTCLVSRFLVKLPRGFEEISAPFLKYR